MMVYNRNTDHIYIYINRKYANFQNFILIPGVQENDFPDFFTKKSGNLEIVAGNPGISSETTQESR